MHTSPDVLALMALGETVGTPGARAHVAGCGRCGTELDRLRGVVEVGRATADEELITPPVSVWERVREQTTGSGAVAPAASDTGTTGITGPVPVSGPETPADAGGAREPRPAPAGAPGARRGVLLVALAAAVALVAGFGIGLGWPRWTAPQPTVVASTPLDPVGDWPAASGSAQLEQGPDGRQQLVVSVDADEPQTGWREVWLISPNLSDMVSLGQIPPDGATLTVPAGLDLATFPLVDVSLEPVNDGVPAHSGVSIVRGELPH